MSITATNGKCWPIFRDRKAATLVEFGMIGVPVVLWIASIFFLGMHFLTQASIDNATHAVARQMQIGAIRAGTATQVRDFMCPLLAGLVPAPCSSLQIYVTSGAQFSALTKATIVGTTLSRSAYVPGGLDSRVLLQVAYNNPAMIPVSGMDSLTIMSSVAFKNEP